MRRISIFIILILVAFVNFSCANLKSSLSKSDGTDYSSRPSYASASRDSVTAVKTSNSYNTGRTDERNINSEIRNDRREISSPAADQNLSVQYAEMDKVADRIIYELEINEKQKESLLDRFKSASSGDRENINQELNRLDGNQLTLYKAYVRIYKDGKSNWPAVRKSVEDTLLNLRGIGNK